MPKISFLLSAGGAPVFTSLEILKELGIDPCYEIICDRICPALLQARKLKIKNSLYEFNRNISFSKFAKQKIKSFQSNLIFSLFSKHIDIKHVKDCINIHPGCLSSRPGLKAVEQSFVNKDSILITTAHNINEKFDEGKPRLISLATINKLTLNDLNRISYAMKTFLITTIIFKNFSENKSEIRIINGATCSINQIKDFKKIFISVNPDFPKELINRIF